MGGNEKLIRKILSGQSDSSISFSDLVGLLESLGFDHRQRGSHHIFTKSGIIERINLQADGPKAKGYQVRQVRKILTENKLIENE